MKEKRFLKISDENILMIVLAFMCFSIGVWSNYRQLWLENVGFSITSISKILSIGLICSAVIAFIISLFSTKVNIKSIIVLSILFRSVAMTILLFSKDTFIIKTGILLGIMCEVIFTIAFYPLLTFVTKTNKSFRKKTLIEYFAKDIGIVSCGLLIGVSIGKLIFSYDTCLLIALIASFLSLLFLLFYQSREKHNKSDSSLIESTKRLIKSKTNVVFLINQIIINISYGIIFDLMVLILTNYINFEVSLASVFIIVCNVLGSVFTAIFDKFSNRYSVTKSSIIKFGSRALFYILAYLINGTVGFILAIVVAFITSRILEDKVTGVFLRIIDKNDQFLYGNIRYFVVCIGEGIGAFLAGVLLGFSFKYLFLGAGIVTIVQTLIYIYLDKKLLKK